MIISETVKARFNSMKNGVKTLKLNRYSLAKELTLTDDTLLLAESSVSVKYGIERVELTPCEDDGSVYLITDEIGLISEDDTVQCTIMFLTNDIALVSLDDGYLCYKDGDKVYMIGNNGSKEHIGLHKIKDCKSSLPWLLGRWSNQSAEMVNKYVYNFIFNYLFAENKSKDIFTLKVCGVLDVFTRPYGLRYEKLEIIEDSIDEYEEQEEQEEEVTEIEEELDLWEDDDDGYEDEDWDQSMVS